MLPFLFFATISLSCLSADSNPSPDFAHIQNGCIYITPPNGYTLGSNPYWDLHITMLNGKFKLGKDAVYTITNNDGKKVRQLKVPIFAVFNTPTTTLSISYLFDKVEKEPLRPYSGTDQITPKFETILTMSRNDFSIFPGPKPRALPYLTAKSNPLVGSAPGIAQLLLEGASLNDIDPSDLPSELFNIELNTTNLNRLSEEKLDSASLAGSMGGHHPVAILCAKAAIFNQNNDRAWYGLGISSLYIDELHLGQLCLSKLNSLQSPFAQKLQRIINKLHPGLARRSNRVQR